MSKSHLQSEMWICLVIKKVSTKNNKKHITIYFFDKDKTARVNPLLDWLAVAPPTYRHLCIPEVEKKNQALVEDQRTRAELFSFISLFF